MLSFLRRIREGFKALWRALVEIFHEDLDETRSQARIESGPDAAPVGTHEPTLKPGELGIGSAEAPVYQKSKSLLTFQEGRLYQAIYAAVEGRYAVMLKVRMGDFVFLRNEPNDRKFFNNQVLCKHVDFLLCNPSTLKPLLVIELDDSSHAKSAYTVESDNFKNETFQAIGMPMLRVTVQPRYDIDTLRAQIEGKIAPETMPVD